VHFEEHPVWIACHVEDFGEPWYDDTDEETFRPWTGNVPIESGESMFLVVAKGTLADGSTFDSFLTPSGDDGDLGQSQPHLFVDGIAYVFWTGILGTNSTVVDAFYSDICRTAGEVFPIRFSVAPSFVHGGTEIDVPGFVGIGSS
jgi:hypothetical protein